MNDKNLRAPIADAMQRYADDQALAFHTPGHKQGLGAHRLLKRLITEDGLRQEVSLMEELDDLHDPRGIIDDAQRSAARLWRADHALFFINGTTSAVQTMILSTVGEGERILIPRNAHRSVANALILSGAKPVFLCPEFDPAFGIALNVSLSTVERAIEAFPDARALLLTSPNYYGVPADLKSIAELLHRHNKLLLVDEAHGAHLRFSARLPMSATDAGADLAAQSTHKLLGSLTQTSMLMIKSARVDLERIRRVSSMLQSTSPNYLLLASLDIARLQLEEDGAALVERAIDLSHQLRQTIRSIKGLRLFDPPSIDPTKITVNVSGLGLTGLEAEQILRHRLKIQCELSDAENVLFLITYADNQATVDRLSAALKQLSDMKAGAGGVSSQIVRKAMLCKGREGVEKLSDAENVLFPNTYADNQSTIDRLSAALKQLSDMKAGAGGTSSQIVRKAMLCKGRAGGSKIIEPIISPRRAFYSQTATVELKKSVGKISAEEVTFYPPGIPLICPGELITEEIISTIEENLSLGQRIVGAIDKTLNTIRVIANT